jgi:hypothetical protein
VQYLISKIEDIIIKIEGYEEKLNNINSKIDFQDDKYYNIFLYLLFWLLISKLFL